LCILKIFVIFRSGLQECNVRKVGSTIHCSRTIRLSGFKCETQIRIPIKLIFQSIMLHLLQVPIIPVWGMKLRNTLINNRMALDAFPSFKNIRGSQTTHSELNETIIIHSCGTFALSQTFLTFRASYHICANSVLI
jgi:hypothetical protein